MVEGILGRLGMLLFQAQLLLDFFDDTATTRMNEEVVEGLLEVGDIRLALGTKLRSPSPTLSGSHLQQLSTTTFICRRRRRTCATGLSRSKRRISTYLAGDEVICKLGLLAVRKDQGAQSGDVGPQSAASHRHQLLGQLDTLQGQHT